ncbi:MAG: tetratricopeptide repeat protein [Candidatus Yanofskybacteria bacterium]|nr:tetratricopeptide repeat protein [Candidatus Yanofskybacteria bacterium]
MFFFIPFGIFIFSIVSIGWIISRKFVYLKKLTPEVVESVVPEQSGFWAEFFPVPTAYIQKVDLRQYRLNFLAEFEKFLRKLRLFSLKLDAVTNRLINRVRKSVMHHESVISSEAAAQAEQEVRISSDSGRGVDLEEQEHKLILEIATNPKDAGLYKKLGNIYMKMEEWHDAVESFKKAAELDPEDETTRNKLTRLLKKLEKLPI